MSKSFYAGGRQIREGTQGDGFHLTLRRLSWNMERKENKARTVIVVSVKCILDERKTMVKKLITVS